MIPAMDPAPPPLELPFDFAPRLPPSKSIANRALVLAALSNGPVAIAGLAEGELGDDVARLQAGIAALRAGGTATLDAGLGGTTARFLLALAAVMPGRFTITGGARLRERPMGELLAALAQLGARIDGDVRALPATIEGGTLVGGRVRLDASRSSQFLSALLLVGAATPRGIEVELDGALASAPYVEMTLDVLRAFGVAATVERDAGGALRGCRVAPQPIAAPASFAVDSDWSAAGAWLVLERLARSRVDLAPLRRTRYADDIPAIRQPDFALIEALARLDGDGPRTLDVAAIPDQLMNLAVAAAARHGTTRFTGAANLRWKESDRLAVLAEQLGRAGITATVEPDGIVVAGRARLRAATLDACGDHRMAIAFALLAALHPGIEVVGHECVTKSDPRFFAELARARTPAAARCIALVGMRGAGKTTLGAALAARLGLEFRDSDAVCEERGGPIPAIVAQHGWKQFRIGEAFVVDELLAPGRVVAVGGGALEWSATRARLPERAIVLHVTETLATLQARIAASARPSVTGADPVAELPELLERREAHDRGAATITLAPGTTVAERVEEAVAALRGLVRWPQE